MVFKSNLTNEIKKSIIFIVIIGFNAKILILYENLNYNEFTVKTLNKTTKLNKNSISLILYCSFVKV